MFAGAARVAVFSRPDVIRRINSEFVPVALKAALVNNPPGGGEGALYAEIGRSKPAPQGICVVNSAGKVLDWVLMFDDDDSIPEFLDHALARFARFPDAARPVAAERYMMFPSEKLPDAEDHGKAILVPLRHSGAEPCPGRPAPAAGTLVSRVFGRALDPEGKPVTDTKRQEDYVEDRLEVPLGQQQRLAKAAANAGPGRFRIPVELGRLFVNHAYLGQLDVNPVGSPAGEGDLKRCEFWGEKVESAADGTLVVRVEGQSEAAGKSGDSDGGDGRLWRNDVELDWQGFIELRHNRIQRLLLLANGTERLEWRNRGQALNPERRVVNLPAGHFIDLVCSVRFGMIGEPVATPAR